MNTHHGHIIVRLKYFIIAFILFLGFLFVIPDANAQHGHYKKRGKGHYKKHHHHHGHYKRYPARTRTYVRPQRPPAAQITIPVPPPPPAPRLPVPPPPPHPPLPPHPAAR